VALVIHTSDVHLGAPLGWLGDRASQQREQLRRTLSAIVDLSLSEGADCLLVAGDLFDSTSPPSSVVRFALREFGRLTAAGDAAVVLLPGSHDFLDPSSVYSCYRKEFEGVGGVTVLGLDGRASVDLPRRGISIRGALPARGSESASDLRSLSPHPELPYSIAIAHGSVDVVPSAPGDHLIESSAFRSPGWSYFALGHWHSWREIGGGSAPVVYPGAPEVIAMDQRGSGYVARVELEPGRVSVDRVRVGLRSVADATVDITGVPDTAQAASRVRRAARPDPDAILAIVLDGILAVDSGLDAEGLLETLKPDYFFVTLSARHYRVELADRELDGLPERLVVGRFARLMREKAGRAASDQERREIEDALQLGVALLQGKDVLS
jgi:DNA repair exonuclease SbcCD nuclease subunit